MIKFEFVIAAIDLVTFNDSDKNNYSNEDLNVESQHRLTFTEKHATFFHIFGFS